MGKEPIPPKGDHEASTPSNSMPNSPPASALPTSSDDVPPSVMAISNLRCPSPPPILTNSGRNSVTSKSIKLPRGSESGISVAKDTIDSEATTYDHANINDLSQAEKQLSRSHISDFVSPPPGLHHDRPTIPSGGAVLQEKEKEKLKEKINRDHVIDKEQHINNFINNARPPLEPEHSNSSMTSLDYTNNPPSHSSHHKVPSVHAHFYVDETIKHKANRSRSGSTSATGSEYLAGTGPNTGGGVGSKQIGSLERLADHSTMSSPATVGGHSDGASSHKANTNSNSNQPANNLSEQNANIDPRLPQDDGKIHILFGVCGALSTSKIKLIMLRLLEIYGPDNISIQLILTKTSENFISAEVLTYLETVRQVRIWRDADEWNTWKSRADPVLHIELRRWADILIVCPLTANTLSKISLGLCDNLLTNVIRAWNTSYPIFLAPSMVSYSYNAVTTKRQLRLISEEMPWIEILKPVEKVVGSYGDIGMGGMMDYNEIVNKIVLKLGGYPEEEDDDDDDDDDDKKNLDQTLVDDEDEDDDDDDDEDEDDDDDDDDDNDVVHENNKTDKKP